MARMCSFDILHKKVLVCLKVSFSNGERFATTYGGPRQRSPDYSAFGQITGFCPCQLQAPNATWLAWQRAVQDAIPIFIVGLSVYALF